MKFSVSQQDIARELALLAGIAQQKSTIPVLTCIHLATEKDALRLSASDLDVSLTVLIPAEVSRAGSVLLPAKALSHFICQLSDTTIECEVSPNYAATLKAGAVQAVITGISPTNFPPLPTLPSSTITMPSKLLFSVIGQAFFAISSEQCRYTLDGALLEIEKGIMRMVATDGHRVSMVESARNDDAALKALVARRVLEAALPMLEQAADQTHIAATETAFFIATGNRVLSGRTLSGQFPNWRVVLRENDHKVAVVFTAARLCAALRTLKPFIDERSGCVILTVRDGTLTLQATHYDSGTASVNVDAQVGEGAVRIGFKETYLSEFLGRQSGDITLRLRDSVTCGVFTPANTNGYEQKYLVMPMRI